MPVLTILVALIVTVFAPSLAQPPACPLAPAPRVRPGVEAVVAPGVWGLNLRALPAVSTGVRAQVGAGQRLTVISGPSCNGQYWWWRVELPNGAAGWLAEGTWSEYYLIPVRPDGEPRSAVSPAAWSCAGRLDPRRCLAQD